MDISDSSATTKADESTRAGWRKLQKLGAVIDGLSRVLRDDRKLLQQTGVVFDGLHALLSKDAVKPKRKTKRNGKRSKK